LKIHQLWETNQYFTMFELTFSSEAVRDLDRSTLSYIQKKSVEANSKMGVTGCLFFHKNKFMGILEGREEEVEKLFAKIKKDNNHKNISVLAKEQIMDRQFKHWNMISCMKEEKRQGKADYHLSVENTLALIEFAEKRNYGSRVFWLAVKESLEKGNSF